MNIQDKLQKRLEAEGPAFHPTKKELEKIQLWFNDNPYYDLAYFFYDGHIVDADTHNKRLFSRTAQLVSIFTDGFPVIISRKALPFYRVKEN